MIDAYRFVHHFFSKETYGQFVDFHIAESLKAEAFSSPEAHKALRTYIRSTIDHLVGMLFKEMHATVLEWSPHRACHERKCVHIPFPGLRHSEQLAALCERVFREVCGDISLSFSSMVGGITVSWVPLDKRLGCLFGFPFGLFPPDDGDRFHEFRKNEAFTDVEFDVSGSRFRAHRVILALYPFFSRLFDRCASGTNEGEPIHLPDTNAHVFEVVLKYIYTKTASLAGQSYDYLIDVAQTSARIGLEDLKELCHFHLQLALTVDNLFVIAAYASQCHDERLLRACSSVSVSRLSPARLLEILPKAGLYGLSRLEEKLLKAIRRSMSSNTYVFYCRHAQMTQSLPLSELCSAWAAAHLIGKEGVTVARKEEGNS